MRYAVRFLMSLVLLFLLSMPIFATIGDPYWTTNDYETYEENIDSFPLPQGFVYYEDVAFLGDFCSFYGLGRSNYHYRMRSSETELLIRIDAPDFRTSLSEDDHPKLEVSYTEMEDLRFLQNGPGHILIKNAAFVYRDTGELFMICWEDSFGMKTLSLYKGLPKGEFWDQLLNPKTVEVALEKLFRATNAELSEADATTDVITSAVPPSDSENAAFPWLWIALPVGVAVIGGGAVVILLRRKKSTVL